MASERLGASREKHPSNVYPIAKCLYSPGMYEITPSNGLEAVA